MIPQDSITNPSFHKRKNSECLYRIHKSLKNDHLDLHEIKTTKKKTQLHTEVLKTTTPTTLKINKK